MYRLLIVDDEAGHRAGLIGQLRTLKPEYLVFEAENGAVALQMMDVVDFDLVLTDIRMPQLDGLSFLEYAKKKHCHTRVAILSAYGLFDYAKRSVSLGADDYLLKPVDAEELRHCLDRMENRLESKWAVEQSDDNVETQMYLFVTGSLSEREQASIRALFGDHRAGIVLHAQPVGAWHNDEIRAEFQYRIRQRLKQCAKAAVFRSAAEQNAVIGIAACDEQVISTVQACLADELGRILHQYNQRIIAGICIQMDAFFDQLEKAYNRARVACMQHFFNPEQTIFTADFEQEPDPFSSMRLDVSIKALDSCLSGGDLAQAKAMLEEQLRRLCTPGAYPSKIKEGIMYTFIFLLANLTFPLSKADKESILSIIDKTVLECDCLGDMLQAVRLALDRIASTIDDNRKMQHEAVFTEVLRYIETHYAKDLSLASVATQFHYHPSYFSTLFKHNVGSTFSEYLFEIRMREAARLLTESKVFASKVGQLVGYPSAAYFTKAFKKQFGMSPDQFRKRGRKTE